MGHLEFTNRYDKYYIFTKSLNIEYLTRANAQKNLHMESEISKQSNNRDCMAISLQEVPIFEYAI